MEDTLLLGPVDGVAGKDGVYAIDFQAHRVVALDRRSGTLAWIAGREGAGPAELRNPMGAALAPDGDLLVIDFGNGRVVRYRPDGSPVSTTPVPGVLSSLCALGDGSMLGAASSEPPIVRISENGTVQERYSLPWQSTEVGIPSLRVLMTPLPSRDGCVVADVVTLDGGDTPSRGRSWTAGRSGDGSRVGRPPPSHASCACGIVARASLAPRRGRRRVMRKMTPAACTVAAFLLAMVAACEPQPPDETATGEAQPVPPASEAAPGPADTAVSLDVRQKEGLGTYLTDASGRSLYLFQGDTAVAGGQQRASTCYDECAQAWPPLLVAGAPVPANPAIRAEMIGTVERRDGARQVTYNGWPLYYYARDLNPGDTNGQDVEGFGAEWYLVTPEGEPLRHEGGNDRR